MLRELLGELKENRQIIIVLMIGFFLSSNASNSVLDRVWPKDGHGDNRGPASTPRDVLATERYVDQRIAELDAKSALRHEASMKAIEAGMNSLGKAMDNLSARVDRLASFSKHAALKDKLCPFPAYATGLTAGIQKAAFTTCN